MKSRPGLTLVDLMVALAILAIVLTAVYSVFAFQEKTLRAASEGGDIYGQSLLILDRLSRDLSGAWLPNTVKQDARIDYRFAGQIDSLNFLTTAAMSLTETAGPDLVEVGYRVEEIREEDEDGTEEIKVLVRRQDDTLDDDPAGGGTEIILVRNLSRLTFSYLDASRQEKTTWETQKSTDLPRAVRIELVLAGANEEEETFLTLVDLPMAQPTIKPIANDLGLELSR